MNNKLTATTKLRRSAWVGVIGGWLLAVLFAVMAAATIYLRNAVARHWPAGQTESFQSACLTALASSPSLADRFQRLCSQLNFATSTAEDFMLWLAVFSVLIAFLSVGHALFAQKVLMHLKGNEIHNHTPDGIRRPADGAPNPSV